MAFFLLRKKVSEFLVREIFAEAGGFEPPAPVKARRFSRPLLSTAQPRFPFVTILARIFRFANIFRYGIIEKDERMNFMTENKTREEKIREFLEAEWKKDSRRETSVFADETEDGKETENVTTESLPPALPPGEEELSSGDGGAYVVWEGPEFEVFARDWIWYGVAASILLLIVIYAIIVNSPIMAVTFILIGVVGYIYLQKEPRHLTFAVTDEGVVVGDEVYRYDDIESFWIFYEPPHTYLLSLRVKNHFTPHIHIPLHQVDPVLLRRTLVEFVPEVRQEMGLVDTLERLFHI